MTAHQALSREPQQDRSRATRRRLLEAAIGCLSSVGWAGTTVAVVAERAGVSRGAAQHHFRTREELVTAAVDYGSEVRMTQMRERLDALADHRPSTLAVVTLLGEMYTSPLFRAALQLWVAASSDEQLRAQVVPLEAAWDARRTASPSRPSARTRQCPVSARPSRRPST